MSQNVTAINWTYDAFLDSFIANDDDWELTPECPVYLGKPAIFSPEESALYKKWYANI